MVNRLLILFIFISASFAVPAQDFTYGMATFDELGMTTYDLDTGASAVVLKEFGEASISGGDGYHLIFKHHVRIKILRKGGMGQADIEIPLYIHDNNRFERITSLKASSFNIENGRIREEALSEKDIFTEVRNEHRTVKKFAIPSVKVGTVIEYTYTLESPFVFNFRGWEFQSDIPKRESEFRASIPAIYVYNISLRGYLKLDKNESTLVADCIGGSGIYAPKSADCSLLEFGMKNIPAFVEEDYMTSKKNFISAIRFELSEVRHFDGRVDKVTREWKDAEEELRREHRFGVQLKRGKELGKEVEVLVQNEADDLIKAKKVYDFIKGSYTWNDAYGMFSEFGIKKAFDARKGNVGDINLSLVAAMRFAGLDAEPVILSTRANGTVLDLYPVLSEFNYVIAKINIGDKVYLADATVKGFPFGLLPQRCLNGKGRVIGDRKSYWIDLKPADVAKTFSLMSLVLGTDGVMRGTINSTFIGYDAVTRRREILSHPSQDAYVNALRPALGQMEILSCEISDLEQPGKPVTRKLEVQLTAFDDLDAASFLFSPFLLDKWPENPFKSKERLYPVDFGVPLERTTVLHLEYPPDYEIVNVPEQVGLALPEGGGRFIFQAQNVNKKLSISNSLSIRKTVYSSVEYHYLKELFNRIIQVQNEELIFKKKT